MESDAALHWAKQLSSEQHKQLDGLNARRCKVEVAWAPPDPLHDLPAGLVMEAMVDKHAVMKVRGTDVGAMFDYIYQGAVNLLNYVQEVSPEWHGALAPPGDKSA
ncbi:hypothetical protein [Deinococcus peraridilitoris]|uniref:Uncharacterized protein n=1 Tax=Deinococcus peraridilitoris (strain DSM 19664 / LMG 22246 / CIP 109416 / KR-200) TaxID=937777 RepID=L0A1H6_DEIPD|nr:hypothetical protein [Deinococcus peraridilitoris]AFZ66865.1 hypothetical protein Deipe_1316 [Deinococcus peraridilitoris DSM 19664]